MPSDIINSIKEKFGICNTNSFDKEENVIHVCTKKKKHTDKHKCNYCQKEWENDTGTERKDI